MALAVSLLFDEEADRAVRRVWQMLAEVGVCRFMQDLDYAPHLSLLVSDDQELEGRLNKAVADLRDFSTFEIGQGPVRHFPDTKICWLACTDTGPVGDLHAFLMARLPANAIRPHYRPGQWTPHVTVQMSGDVEDGLRRVRTVWPDVRRASVLRIEVVRFMPVKRLGGIDLA